MFRTEFRRINRSIKFCPHILQVPCGFQPTWNHRLGYRFHRLDFHWRLETGEDMPTGVSNTVNAKVTHTCKRRSISISPISHTFAKDRWKHMYLVYLMLWIWEWQPFARKYRFIEFVAYSWVLMRTWVIVSSSTLNKDEASGFCGIANILISWVFHQLHLPSWKHVHCSYYYSCKFWNFRNTRWSLDSSVSESFKPSKMEQKWESTGTWYLKMNLHSWCYCISVRQTKLSVTAYTTCIPTQNAHPSELHKCPTWDCGVVSPAGFGTELRVTRTHSSLSIKMSRMCRSENCLMGWCANSCNLNHSQAFGNYLLAKRLPIKVSDKNMSAIKKALEIHLCTSNAEVLRWENRGSRVCASTPFLTCTFYSFL